MMMVMAPTVLFVPGFWVGGEPFAQVTELVAKAGLKIEITILTSTGTTSPGNPSMQDDISGVRRSIETILEKGEDVLLVLHSAGGFIGGSAADGLTKAERYGGSGVVGAVFLAGAVFPAGFEHHPLPFAIFEGGASYCAESGKSLYGDLPESEQERWVAKLRPQPAQGWDGIVPSAPWSKIPSVYVICEKDNLLPVPLQEQLAATANAKIERVAAGHMAMVVLPQEVSSIIIKAATGAA